jgi:hypothetical protein
MQPNLLSNFLIVGGALMMLNGLSLLPTHEVALASEAIALAQPSPRPPIASTPRPDDDDNDNDESTDNNPQPLGSITGTVIDQRTGAPAAGVLVNVGGSMVATDASGNYEYALPAGHYGVLLMLSEEQGIASQGLRPVALEPGARVVVHLAFRSAELIPNTPPAPLAPPAPVVAPTALPAAPASAPAQPISELPNTSVEAPPAAVSPASLPHTGARTANIAWLWLALGAALVVGGVALRPYASMLLAAARQTPLLATLIGASVSDRELLRRLVLGLPTRTPDDELLATLIHDGIEKES